MALKITNDLERMGDLAKKIGKNVVYLCGVPPTGANIRRMRSFIPVPWLSYRFSIPAKFA